LFSLVPTKPCVRMLAGPWIVHSRWNGLLVANALRTHARAVSSCALVGSAGSSPHSTSGERRPSSATTSAGEQPASWDG